MQHDWVRRSTGTHFLCGKLAEEAVASQVAEADSAYVEYGHVAGADDEGGGRVVCADGAGGAGGAGDVCGRAPSYGVMKDTPPMDRRGGLREG